MHHVLIAGAGKIGSVIACILTHSKEYQVHVVDLELNGPDIKRLLKKMPEIKTTTVDIADQVSLLGYIKKNKIIAVISCMPFFLTGLVAAVARKANIHYFDLTEDTAVTKEIRALAHDATSAFVPQCGLAPGFISIVTHHLIQEFSECSQVRLRVGALPQRAIDSLHYSLTWSTDGLINEYANPCDAIEQGIAVTLPPLEGLESIQINGCEYEAFNTSGGLGNLVELYAGKIQRLNYKTIRYPGHCQKVRFLMQDLQLACDRTTLKSILEHAIAHTYQDTVLVYVSVEGVKEGKFTEKSYFKQLLPRVIHELEWSAIQVSTGAGMCAVVDLLLNQSKPPHGFVAQEYFKFEEVVANRFGRYFEENA